MRTQLNSDQFVASIEDNNIELKKELDKFKNGEFIELKPTTTTTAEEETEIKQKDKEITVIDNNNKKDEENHRKDTIETDLEEQIENINLKEEITKAEGEIDKDKETGENKHHIKTENLKEAEDTKQDTKDIITGDFFQIFKNFILFHIIFINFFELASQNNSLLKSSLTNDNITVKDLNTSVISDQKSLCITPPPPPDPIDWKPNDKCHFCVNGKLLTVNAKGELVAESGPIGSETDHIQKVC